jgi:hypothetical protein
VSAERRSCSCGGTVFVAGTAEIAVSTIIVAFEALHSGAGHEPVSAAEARDIRAAIARAQRVAVSS